jgi:hypothetical protein
MNMNGLVCAGRCSIISLLALLSSPTHAGTSWFGLDTPASVADPHRPVVNVAAAKLAPAIVPQGEERNRELGGERIKQDVATIVDFSRASRARNDKLWGRVTGFPSAKATIEWSAKQLERAGMKNVEVQEYDAAPDTSMWWATNWEARVIGDTAFGEGSRDVVLTSAVPASGSMIDSGSLRAPLVYVGSINDPLPKVEVRGKVAVQHLKPQHGAYSERRPTVERARELTARGALAVINVVEQTGNMHIRDFGNCGAPCFNLGTADGVFLQSVMDKAAQSNSAAPRIELKLDAKQLTGLKGHNAVGIVPGKSDENIIVNAHADGWYDAAGDNADGLAVLLAMARHFAQPANKPERTLIFVASGGHHSSGLNGPSNFVKMNPRVTANTVMVLNLEHIAQVEIAPGTWQVNPREQPMNFGIDNAAPYLQDLGKRGMERYGFNLNPTFTTTVAGDLGGYAPLGVARVQAIHSGPMYHASGDVLETISVPGLERAARFYTYFVTEAAASPRGQINPARAPQ